jgi:arabinogalactan oligomer/maltooligosaccharide transport system permease protein
MTVPTAIAPPAARSFSLAGLRFRGGRTITPLQQLGLQLLCLFITGTVLFPVVWILSMSLDPRNIARPTGLDLVPPGASLEAYQKVIAQPTENPVSFVQLALNSLTIAVIVAVVSVAIGIFAAYAFSRMRFPGRQFLMIAILAVLMLPAVATIAPLFVSLNKIQFGTFNLRNSLLGVSIAVTSGQLPFAIWNMKGYLDTIPRELEEAAEVDGAGRFTTFWRIVVPLARPVIAVTAFFGFLAGWTEFYFSWTFLNRPENFTLAMALNGMVGQYAGNTRWSEFAAFAVLVALPVSVVYFWLQRYIISGLTIGSVKG